MTPPLVSTEWLAVRLNDPGIRIADVRCYLLNPDQGRQEYLQGHILGAIYFHIDHDLAMPPYQGPGRHPLPTSEKFAAIASSAGIGRRTHVVAYDSAGGSVAARLWWLLRYFGHENVSLLDGGITRWVAEGRPLQKEIPSRWQPTSARPTIRACSTPANYALDSMNLAPIARKRSLHTAAAG